MFLRYILFLLSCSGPFANQTLAQNVTGLTPEMIKIPFTGFIGEYKISSASSAACEAEKVQISGNEHHPWIGMPGNKIMSQIGYSLDKGLVRAHSVEHHSGMDHYSYASRLSLNSAHVSHDLELNNGPRERWGFTFTRQSPDNYRLEFYSLIESYASSPARTLECVLDLIRTN